MVDSLYETIGGRLRIEAAVDLFYQKVLADSSISQFFDGVDLEHLRARQSMFLTMLFGGQVYADRDVREAHARPRAKGLNDSHFDAFLKHFQAALEEVGVRADTVHEVMKLLETTRAAVLNR